MDFASNSTLIVINVLIVPNNPILILLLSTVSKDQVVSKVVLSI